jgi:hypothetical protein
MAARVGSCRGPLLDNNVYGGGYPDMASDVKFASRSQLVSTDGFHRLIGNTYRFENDDAGRLYCYATILPLRIAIFGWSV